LSYQLILASASPRRRQFLDELGLAYQLLVADIDETPLTGERPRALAQRLAEAKARAVATRLPPGDGRWLVIAADTVVALGDTLLGKPADSAEASAMLSLLRGRVHEVHSGVSVYEPGAGILRTRVNTTEVRMRVYHAEEIAAYIATGDPFDKAGGYAIQNREFAPVVSVHGCISGVIGLPLADLRDLLASFGVVIPHGVVSACEPHTHFPCCQTPNQSTDPPRL
jgi:nucleoside triphosphate pyrophosphatase